jgi:hypothetical protein
MTELARDEEFSAFVLARRPELLRSACLLTAGDWHSAEDLGKLVVTQESFDTSSAQGWTSARIPGHTAYYSVQDDTASLVIEQTTTRWLLAARPGPARGRRGRPVRTRNPTRRGVR